MALIGRCVVYTIFMMGMTSAMEINFLHTNDFHAHFEQFNIDGDRCSTEEENKQECFGGVARMVTKVNEIRAQNPNTILVDAGDQLGGTNWFYHYEGRATAYFFNKIGFDAMVCIFLYLPKMGSLRKR